MHFSPPRNDPPSPPPFSTFFNPWLAAASSSAGNRTCRGNNNILLSPPQRNPFRGLLIESPPVMWIGNSSEEKTIFTFHKAPPNRELVINVRLCNIFSSGHLLVRTRPLFAIKGFAQEPKEKSSSCKKEPPPTPTFPISIPPPLAIIKPPLLLSSSKVGWIEGFVVGGGWSLP